MWVGVKHIKSSKKSHLGSKATEWWSIIYTLTVIEEARLIRQFVEANKYKEMFQNDDFRFYKNLVKQGVNVGAL